MMLSWMTVDNSTRCSPQYRLDHIVIVSTIHELIFGIKYKYNFQNIANVVELPIYRHKKISSFISFFLIAVDEYMKYFMLGQNT